MVVLPAAGTVPWRVRKGALEVLLVHRPRYDDWSWPKGKLDPGEDWPVAAVRETFEEAALQVRLGQPLPPSSYTVLDRAGQPVTKHVEYWAAHVIGGDGIPIHEVDQTLWLDAVAAHDRLDYARDRDQLRALIQAHQRDELATHTVALVRHAKARSRSSWAPGIDSERPLDAVGEARAHAIVPLLAAYGLRRLVTSPSVRCVDTLAPYAAHLGRPLKLRPVISEEGYAAEPTAAAPLMRAVLGSGKRTAVCSHGPVLPDLVSVVLDRAVATGADDVLLARLRAAADGMDKGEVLVTHLAGRGLATRVVGVERHRP